MGTTRITNLADMPPGWRIDITCRCGWTIEVQPAALAAQLTRANASLAWPYCRRWLRCSQCGRPSPMMRVRRD